MQLFKKDSIKSLLEENKTYTKEEINAWPLIALLSIFGIIISASAVLAYIIPTVLYYLERIGEEKEETSAS